jgi:hypothetical protein
MFWPALRAALERRHDEAQDQDQSRPHRDSLAVTMKIKTTLKAGPIGNPWR